MKTKSENIDIPNTSEKEVEKDVSVSPTWSWIGPWGKKESYPPGEAKEDWEIINELAREITSKIFYESKDMTLRYLVSRVWKFKELINNLLFFSDKFNKE